MIDRKKQQSKRLTTSASLGVFLSALIILLILCPLAYGADAVRFEAESMSASSSSSIAPVCDGSTSPCTNAMEYTVSGDDAQKSVTLSAAATQIEIRARSTVANNQRPSLSVFVDGTDTAHHVALWTVNSGTYTTYTDTVNLGSGPHTVYVRCARAAYTANPSDGYCTSNRDLFVDQIAFTYTPAADTTPPDTTINSGPSGLIASASPSWSFSGTDNVGVAGFECSLDGAAYTTCTSPKSYMGLADGSHTFSVRAVDAAGNVDATPATRSITVDTTAPAAPTITAGIAEGATENDGTVTFSFSGESGGSFQCSLDQGTPSYSTCTSPKQYTNIANGSYTFRVRQVDDAGNVGTETTRNFNMAIPPQDNFPGLRDFLVAGWQPWPGTDVTAAFVDNAYQRYWKPQYSDNGKVYFTIRLTQYWRDMMVDPTATPTHAQMRDPNWSGYVWNQPGGDEIANALNAQCVQAGECKISLQLNSSATGGNSTPQFMQNEGLAWAGNPNGYLHVKFYNAEARQYASEWVLAYLDHVRSLNHNDDIASVRLGEYYPQATKPADWPGQSAFETGYRDFLQTVVNGIPPYSDGDRLVLTQSNPLISPDSMTCSDLLNMKVGIAKSDPTMFEESATSDIGSCARLMHGVLPMGMPGDAGDYNASDPQHYTTWDSRGVLNPFGYTLGQTVGKTCQNVAWYYSHGGVQPQDQELVLAGNAFANCFQADMDRFGPGGTQSALWGQIPYPN